MKDKKIIVLLALCVALASIAGAMIMDNMSSSPSATDKTTTVVAAPHEEYPDLPEENVVVRESAAATIDRFNRGSGIIFLGFKECPWCQKLLPIANEVAAAEGEKVFYLDIRALRQDNSPEYQQLLDILSPHLKKDENGEPRIYVPDMSIVKNGKIIGRYEMEETEEAEPTPDSYWTDERRERAKQTLRDQIKELKAGAAAEGQ